MGTLDRERGRASGLYFLVRRMSDESIDAILADDPSLLCSFPMTFAIFQQYPAEDVYERFEED